VKPWCKGLLLVDAQEIQGPIVLIIAAAGNFPGSVLRVKIIRAGNAINIPAVQDGQPCPNMVM
jgi:hypothetical protein